MLKRHYLFLLIKFLAVFLIISSCKKNDLLVLDLEFSVNVAKPGEAFPGKGQIEQAKKEVMEIYGEPDYVQIWWSQDGRFHQSLEVDRKLRDPEIIYEKKKSWIYLDRELECEFLGPTRYREKPLSDKMKTICEYGDPENIIKLSESSPYRENWQYYSLGLILKFKDDELIGQSRHTPLRSWFKY